MAPPPPPPPPPPPMCLPFVGKKTKRISWEPPPSIQGSQLIRNASYSSSSTYSSMREKKGESITFHSDSENYGDIPDLSNTKGDRPKLSRSNTMTGTKKSFASKLGYGWGLGRKQKEMEAQVEEEEYMEEKSFSQTSQASLPPWEPPVRSNSKSTQASRVTSNSKRTLPIPPPSNHMSPQPSRSNTRSSDKTVTSRPTHVSRVSSGSRRHPGHDSTSTLVGSAYERKVNELDTVPEKVNSSERLAQLRALMEKENLQYYVVPSEDAHNSEYVAPTDKRREWISGFTGSAGQAIISRNNAYLVTDSRYWLQARDQVDSNWTIIEAGKPGQPKDWIDFLSSRVKDAKIGIDARMISHEKATLLNSKIHPLGSKLAYPPQNLVDLIWRDKPQRSRASIFLHGLEYAGESANSKIAKVREWIRKQPPDVPSYSRSAPRASQQHVGTLITSLPAIAYLLNLRGSDIPFNPVFQAYLYIALNPSSKHPHTLFVDPVKIKPEIDEYLNSIDVVRRDYTELWAWLRLRQWGDGKVIISPETSYAVSLMLTHMRYTLAPSHVEVLMSVKNETELAGMRRAYIRDGIAFTRFLAWLENKMAQGYEVTEWEAGHRLTEFRRQHKPEWMGLAYENISATGPNAALPHYSPKKGNALVISRETPYLNDSGGQYRDGTCDTTRTMHFGRPTPEMCEAYTKVLQGHIAIDTAIFPEGTSGQQLDVLARRALWKDGWNYMHGTGHGFGQFLTVHEGPHGFSSSIPLVPGHVITNEPGFYNAGQWGMRIESALIVTRVNTRREFNGHIWLGFERLTCVPIQTRMVKESMLTKEEKAWLKDHNQRCYETLAPHLKDDKSTLKWLRREAERGIGLANPAAGLTIDWD